MQFLYNNYNYPFLEIYHKIWINHLNHLNYYLTPFNFYYHYNNHIYNFYNIIEI